MKQAVVWRAGKIKAMELLAKPKITSRTTKAVLRPMPIAKAVPKLAGA